MMTIRTKGKRPVTILVQDHILAMLQEQRLKRREGICAILGLDGRMVAVVGQTGLVRMDQSLPWKKILRFRQLIDSSACRPFDKSCSDQGARLFHASGPIIVSSASLRPATVIGGKGQSGPGMGGTAVGTRRCCRALMAKQELQCCAREQDELIDLVRAMSTKLIDVVEAAAGESLVAHQKGGYEAEKALENIFRITCQPLTEQKINGKVITSTSLLGKDANHQGATFTARMQPKISAGDDMELFFSCSNLVQLWHIKAYRQPKVLLIVKEKLENGKWQEVGRTESTANTCHPNFSRSVLVRYKGIGVQQQIMVLALSYAKNTKNDDLVNSRTARVMKLPLLSADQTKSTGFLTINGSHHDAVEDGVWVTLNIRAENLLRPRGNFARKKDDLPNTFFEIWRHSIEGEKQVYKSETVACKSNPIWWPMALNSKKIRGSHSPDGQQNSSLHVGEVFGRGGVDALL
eukprot:760593-Hanusia_phi.AAC.5